MNLYISKEKDPGVESDAVYLEPTLLTGKSIHLSLAAMSWDTLYIELSDSVPEGFLKFLRDKVKSIKVREVPAMNKHILNLLIELFPDKEGQLRKVFMTGGNINGVLLEMW